MPLILAVVEDLSQFAFGALRNLVGGRETAPAVASVIPLGAPAFPLALPHAKKKEMAPPEIQTPVEVIKNTIMYTASTEATLRSAPGASGDATVAVLPYGSMVMVLQVEDPWVYVASGPHQGWVYKEDLEDRAAHVYPAFHIGEENLEDDPATIRLRASISDEFGAGELGLPLQAEEYVLYRLMKRGIKIAWPPIRPRRPGSWATILRGAPGVWIAVVPSAQSIMEFQLRPHGGDAEGHLAYVEAIFPDGAIQISEANWPDVGVYNERVLVKSEWQELAPVFISF